MRTEAQKATCCSYLSELAEFVQEHMPYEIRGASILIVVARNHCKIKLIDLACVKKYEEETWRDEGFILGLKSIQKIIS